MKATKLCRFSVAMNGDLVSQLDDMTKANGYASRSQAIAASVRNSLVEHYGHMGKHEIAGTVTLVYDHHKRNIQALLTDIQHDHGNLIIAAMHVHLDHHNCMEVLAVRGRADAVRTVADRLIAAKGVKHGRLVVTTTGEEFQK
ncbi:MAG: nickel-responsive transcriptional regulator NikR [Kiritimatiellae bacterium]|nr:nickel-responsive transcriptional regulator NikR [Kiritimatiellia bacterium]